MAGGGKSGDGETWRQGDRNQGRRDLHRRPGREEDLHTETDKQKRTREAWDTDRK